MPNEILVSNVKYKGNAVGSANLTVEDTSNYPDYTVTVTDGYTDAAVATNDFKQLGRYNFDIKSTVGKVANVNTIYFRMITTDGKLNAGTYIDGAATLTKDQSRPVDANGNVRFVVTTDFFPSLSGYTGRLEIYHDSARTFLIASYNITVKGLTSASLAITNDTSLTNATTTNPVRQGDRVNYRVRFSGKVGIPPFTVNAVCNYKATIAGISILTDNPWVETHMGATFNVLSGTIEGGDTYMVSKTNPANSARQYMEFRMGDLVASTWLEKERTINDFGSPFVAQTMDYVQFPGAVCYAASLVPYSVFGRNAIYHGFIQNKRTWFGKFNAVVEVLSSANTTGLWKYSQVQIRFVNGESENAGPDTTTTKPDVLYLRIESLGKAKLNRDTSLPAGGDLQRYYCESAEISKMCNMFASVDGVLAEYQLTLV